LEEIGKVEIDERRSILLDCCLSIGPLKVSAVIAGFGVLPTQTVVEGRLMMARPECGEEPLDVDEYRDCIVIFRRGVVSFASKALNAQRAGARAAIVLNTLDKWPFVMTDTSSEASLSIPIVMLSKADSAIIEGMAKESREVSGQLHFGAVENECSICQFSYEPGHVVIKLPCRHVYHCDCVSTWLQRNNSCPLCRLALPAGTPREQARDRNRVAAGELDSHSQPYFY